MADTGLLEIVWALEMPLGIASTTFALWGLWRFLPLGRHPIFRVEANPGLGLLRLCVLAGLAWVAAVLVTGADAQVQGMYTYIYAAFGVAATLWAGLWRPVVGLWMPSDVVERGNLAAALALGGFVLGTAFAFGGALTGDDASCAGARMQHSPCPVIVSLASDFPPGSVGTGGWHVVLVFFALAYAELRAGMALLDRLGGGLARQAAVDRDPSAGLLLGATAVTIGLIAGRAAAGDYYGWAEAWRDYGARIWPALPVPFAAAGAGFLTTGRAYAVPVRVATSLALVAAGTYFMAWT